MTSAAGANGAGYGKIIAFADDGKPIGVFGSDPRIVDPRGLGSSRIDGLLFVNSGSGFWRSTATDMWCTRAEASSD